MRERLVGALVLLCIGVVLWSMLFTGTVEHKVDRRTQIPPPIVIDRPDQAAPQRPTDVRPVAEDVRNPRPQRIPELIDAEPESEPPEPAPAEQPAATKPEPRPEPRPKPKPEPAPAPAPEKKAEAPKQRPALDSDTRLPEAWVIQVGVFGQQANAENFKEKLQKDGHKAYLKKVKTKKGDLHRLLVGPLLIEADAEKSRDQIAKKYKVKPIVQRFER